MPPDTRSYLQTLRCAAPLEQLWDALVLPESLRLWHAEEAQVEPVAGGVYRYRSRLFGPREARIDTCEPGRRLRLVYRPNPAWPPQGAGAIVEDFLIDLRPIGAGREQAQLRLIGSGVPADAAWDAAFRRLQAGWAVAFSYLQRRLERNELERRAS